MKLQTDPYMTPTMVLHFLLFLPALRLAVFQNIHKQIERERAKRTTAPDNFAPQTECANTHFQEKDPFADIRAV